MLGLQMLDRFYFMPQFRVAVSVLVRLDLSVVLELLEFLDEVGRGPLVVFYAVPKFRILLSFKAQVFLHVPVDLVCVVLAVDDPVHLVYVL